MPNMSRCAGRVGGFAVAFLVVLGAANQARAVSPDVLISQVYGGGGNSGANYRNDFIELFNRGPAAVNLAGWSVQYAASAGSSWAATPLSGTLQPGQFYLVQQAMGAGGSLSLPTPDAIGTLAMSGTTGKVALVQSTTALTGACPSAVVDLVGYGGANCFETSPTPTLSNTTAAARNSACVDTDNNGTDFGVVAPTPRNSSVLLGVCGDAAPSVSSTTPLAGASNVGVNSAITVSFSEAVNVTVGAVTIECPSGTPVAANASALSNGTTLNIVPAAPLPPATVCSIRVSASGVNDVDSSDPPDLMAANFTASFTTAGGVSCAAVATPIGQIQGTGTSAALSGTQTVRGVVVADFEYPGTGTATDCLRGFFVQNLAGADDGDPATSDAIFAFNGSNNSVSVGQIVQVTGSVTEFDFFSTGGTLTELTNITLELCGSSGAVTPVSLSLPFASASQLERYEGMLVSFPHTLYVSEHFQLGRFGQVLLSSGARLPQPTNIANPGAAALAQQAANDLNQIMLDDDLQAQNPDPIRFGRGGLPLSASNTLRGGDSLSGLTGVLTQTDATTASNVPATSDPVLYRMRTFNVLNASTPSFQALNARPSVPVVVSGTLKVSAFNLLNYFNTFSGCTTGVGGPATDCRGADNAAEFVRQSNKTVQAVLATGADILALGELENDGYGAGSSMQDLIGKLNSATAPGTYAFIDVDARTSQANALGSDAIRVGMIYKPAKAVPVGQTAVANTGAFGIYTTTTGAIQRSRPALAQAFQHNVPNGGTVIVVANHLKSKGSSCADNVSPVGPDLDTGDGQGECNLTRTAAANQLVSWLQSNPTSTGDSDVLILGDLNAYAKEDPIVALQNGGYTNLIASRLGALAYSYAFDGQWGYLDHALASASLASQVTGLAELHINADEPNVLDYNTDFKSAAQQTSLYAADAFRASDHDPVVVGLTLTGTSTPVAVPALGGRSLSLMALLLLALGACVFRKRETGEQRG